MGAKVTEIVQLAPAFRLVPQLPVWANCVGLAPVSPMLVMLSAAVPVLVSVTVWAELVVPTVWLPKATLLGLRLTAGTPTPAPVRLTLCGLPGALSVTVSEADWEEAVVGAKVTEIVQLAPAFRLVPQLPVWANCVGLAPVSPMLVMLSVAVPVLVSVTVWAELVVPTVWLPKATLLGLRMTAGAPTPAPVRLTLCGLPGALSVTVSEADWEEAVVGAKVTEIVQLAPAFRLVPAVTGLGELRRVGAGEPDAGDAECRSTGVGKRDRLGGTGGAHRLVAKGHTART